MTSFSKVTRRTLLCGAAAAALTSPGLVFGKPPINSS